MVGRWIVWAVMFHFLVLGVAFGEDDAMPFSSSISAVLIEPVRDAPVRLAPPRIQALDMALYTGIAGYRAMDYVSTRRALGAGAREAELPQWVVANSQTFLSFEVLATMVEAGTSLWLIRKGHRYVARTFNAASISLGTNTVLHNYRVAAAE
jgi:hypothetical protein